MGETVDSLDKDSLSGSSDFPTLNERLQSIFIDGIVVLCLIVGFSYLFDYLGGVSNTTRKVAFVFVFFAYEPIFVSFFGGSIGHYAMGLRVKRKRDLSKNIFILTAIFRYVIKAVLGIISFLTISSDEERRAIHDKLTGSIVVYRKNIK